MASFTFPDYRVGEQLPKGSAPGLQLDVPLSAFGSPQAEALQRFGSALDRAVDANRVEKLINVAHLRPGLERLWALGVGDGLLDRGAQDLGAGAMQDIDLLRRVGCDAVEPRQLAGGAGLGLGEARDLVVVVVLQLGRANEGSRSA
jgi:hypothetical protein